MLHMLRSHIRRLKADTKGVAAVEFALILPLLVALYVGTIEVSFLVEANQRVTTTTSSLGDLVARTPEVDYCEVDNIFDAARMIIRPETEAELQMRLTSIVEDDDTGDAVVEWSQGRAGLTAFAAGTVLEIDENVLPASGSVIMAEVNFTHKSLFHYNGPFFEDKPISDTPFSQRYYLRPRESVKVEWVGTTNNPGNC